MFLSKLNQSIALIAILLITAPLFSQSQPEKEKKEKTGKAKFGVAMILVKATPERLKVIPEKVREKCVHDGNIAYLICQGNKGISEKGIEQKHIIGIIVDPKLGLKDSNVIEAAYFRNFVWQIASRHMDKNLLDSINNSQAKAAVLIDERVTDPGLPLKQVYHDIIGMYRQVDGKIVFQPNEHYLLFSNFGFSKWTPFIREELLK